MPMNPSNPSNPNHDPGRAQPDAAGHTDLNPASPSEVLIDPLLDELAKRYPYMFEPPNLGLDMPFGWLSVFNGVCVAVDSVLGSHTRGFHWRQLKEKFGSARWYWQIDDVADVHIDALTDAGADQFVQAEQPEDLLRVQLRALIDAATARTATTCIVCGGDGATIPTAFGWRLACCPVHTRLRREDPQAFVAQLRHGHTGGKA